MPLLTAAVLQQAIRQGAAWHAQGRRLTLAVNLSVTNLLDPHFPDQVVDLLAGRAAAGRHAGAGAHRGPVHGRPARGRGRRPPAARGRRVAGVDDYGTGYSSLATCATCATSAG